MEGFGSRIFSYITFDTTSPTVKVNENATFVEDGMDDDIEFDDYSEEEEDVADIDAVSDLLEELVSFAFVSAYIKRTVAGGNKMVSGMH